MTLSTNTIIGILREEKTPPDTRVPLTPKQCKRLLAENPSLQIFVATSPNRCYSDEEYRAEGISIVEDLSHCDILMGVKEVPIDRLIPNKKYLYFSHTIKKQPYNRKLLLKMLELNIQMIDYECLRYENGHRILGFGRFAGIVGAHNGLLDYGRKTDTYALKPAYDCADYAEMKHLYKKIDFPPMRIVITGGGRVAKGAQELIDIAGIQEVSPTDYLTKSYDEAVYTLLDIEKLYRHKEKGDFVRKHFYKYPEQYDCVFAPYIPLTDYMINGIYWSPKAPRFFSLKDMTSADFNIKVIADISCDINGSIPATVCSTKIGDPTFGFDPQTRQKTAPYQAHTVDIMAVDNLPNELPRDASRGFGDKLCQAVIPELLAADSAIVERATISKNGDLGVHYEYLRDYVEG